MEILLRAPQNTQKVEGKELAAAMQTLMKAGLIKIGATGLEGYDPYTIHP
jgi:hypothetical protein